MGTQTEKLSSKGQDFEKMANLAELLKFQLEELTYQLFIGQLIPGKNPKPGSCSTNI